MGTRSMIVIARTNDLKPGTKELALEHQQLANLTGDAYRAAGEAKIVILMREDDTFIKVLKDDIGDGQRGSNVFANTDFNFRSLVMFGVRSSVDYDEPGRFQLIKPASSNDLVGAQWLKGWPGKETLRCCADLCEHCANGFIPTCEVFTDAVDSLPATFSHDLQSGAVPCAAEKIWRRVAGFLI